MSTAEVIGQHGEMVDRLEPLTFDDELAFTGEEIHDEIRVVLADTARFYAEAPERGVGASLVADMGASLRDRTRRASRDRGTLGHLADLIAY